MLNFLTLLFLGFTSFSAVSGEVVSVGIASNFSELSTGSFNPFGGYFRDGVQLALSDKRMQLEGKGLTVKLVEFDYGANDVNVISAAKKAIESKVSVVVGYSYSSNALIAAPLHVKGKLPMLSPSASANRLGTFGRYIHLGSFDNQYMAHGLARLSINELKLKKALILPAVNCAYCVDLSNSFETEFKKLGGVIAKKVPVLQEDKDFNQVLSGIKGLDFDVVFVPNQELTSARVIAALLNAGYSKPFLGADGWGNEGKEFFSVLKGKSFEGYSFTHWHPKLDTSTSKRFVAEYLKQYKKLPNDTSVLAYDSMTFLISVLLKLKKFDRESIENALNKESYFRGVTGNYIIKPNKFPHKDIVVLKSGRTGFEIYKVLPIPGGDRK